MDSVLGSLNEAFLKSLKREILDLFDKHKKLRAKRVILRMQYFMRKTFDKRGNRKELMEDETARKKLKDMENKEGG